MNRFKKKKKNLSLYLSTRLYLCKDFISSLILLSKKKTFGLKNKLNQMLINTCFCFFLKIKYLLKIKFL